MTRTEIITALCNTGLLCRAIDTLPRQHRKPLYSPLPDDHIFPVMPEVFPPDPLDPEDLYYDTYYGVFHINRIS